MAHPKKYTRTTAKAFFENINLSMSPTNQNDKVVYVCADTQKNSVTGGYLMSEGGEIMDAVPKALARFAVKSNAMERTGLMARVYAAN